MSKSKSIWYQIVKNFFVIELTIREILFLQRTGLLSTRIFLSIWSAKTNLNIGLIRNDIGLRYTLDIDIAVM